MRETRRTPLLYMFVNLTVYNVYFYRFTLLTNENVELVYQSQSCKQNPKAASYPGQFALSALQEEAWNRRIFPTNLTGDVTSEITEDEWERDLADPCYQGGNAQLPHLA